MKTHADISRDLLHSRATRAVCPLFARCGYQRQHARRKPEVWITAHDMLFHAQTVFGKPAAVIIDERMWHKGIRGIEDEEKTSSGGAARQPGHGCTAQRSRLAARHARDYYRKRARAGADAAGRQWRRRAQAPRMRP